MNRSRVLAAVAVALVLLVASCTHQLRSRTLADIGQVLDINNRDVIVAVLYTATGPQGVVLEGPDGDSRAIEGPDGAGFVPAAINDSGVVVGEAVTGEGFQLKHRAVRWSEADGFTLIPLPDGTFQSRATDINNRGDIVFNAYTPSGSDADGAYVWSGGVTTRLPDPAGDGRASAAEGINEAGVVVGASGRGAGAGLQRAVRWAAGSHAITVLGPDGVVSGALDVNELGVAVGSSGGSTSARAMAWDGASAIDLGPGVINAINDLGFAVGQADLQATGWTLPTRTSFRFPEIRPGAGGIAVALNNRLVAIGQSGGESVYFSFP